jgi:hypothetical protein
LSLRHSPARSHSTMDIERGMDEQYMRINRECQVDSDVLVLQSFPQLFDINNQNILAPSEANFIVGNLTFLHSGTANRNSLTPGPWCARRSTASWPRSRPRPIRPSAWRCPRPVPTCRPRCSIPGEPGPTSRPTTRPRASSPPASRPTSSSSRQGRRHPRRGVREGVVFRAQS